MNGINLDVSGLENFVNDMELEQIKSRVYEAHDFINNKTGLGSNMLGWLTLAEHRNEEEISRIKDFASRIRKQADVLIVIGIGGSYLGAKAIIDLFTNTFSNQLESSERNFPEIIFAGNNLSGKYLRNLVEYVQDKDFAINVISKSGTTLESAIAFRIFRVMLEDKYGIAGACERIYVTTDANRGVLHDIAVRNGYCRFVVPDNVGGRFSVLTAVGLLPMAVANIDIDDMLDGAQFASFIYNEKDINKNICYKYAAYRNILLSKGKEIEIMASYEPSFRYFIEWFKQLFGESEGKNGKGIFPAGTIFTTDLHSMGQMIQQGNRNIFETVLNVKTDRSFITLPELETNDDGLNYLAGQDIDYINKQAFAGTVAAHISGGVPNIILNIDDINEYNIGELIMFFEKACAISAYVLGVNPFDQPGVEAYKKNMMRLLGK